MIANRKQWSAALALAVISASMRYAAAAGVGDVFVIDMENHNWTQPNGNVVNGAGTGGTTSATGIQQVYGNSAAPFINSLVTSGNPNAAQTSYASNYHNVLATPSGANPSIHPSEPNYLWQESGTNFGIANDNNPYTQVAAPTVPAIQTYLTANPTVSGQNLSGLLQNAGIPWKSYQEDTDLATTGLAGTSNANGNQAAYNSAVNGTIPGANSLTSTPVSSSQYTVPLVSFSGTSTNYTNPYNGSNQYNFAAKHDGSLFYADTNGGNDPTTANTEAGHYAPMQQLANDLNNNTVGKYNLITPDQYNDMHTALTGGFTYNGIHYTGDAAQIAQGDNFLATVIPEIEASQAYQNNGAIVIWWDETEAQSGADTTTNDFSHTLGEIVISPLAKGNAYDSTLDYTHSSGFWPRYRKSLGPRPTPPPGISTTRARREPAT